MLLGRVALGTAFLSALVCIAPLPDVLAQTAKPQVTVTLQIADWLPRWDAGNGGWGLVTAGSGVTGQWAGFSVDTPTMAVPQGRYDLYWLQNTALQPMLVTTNITVGPSGATVPIATGVRLSVADWARFDASGHWEAWPAGSTGPVNATDSGMSMFLAPGDYDIYWQAGADTSPGWMGQVTVAPAFGTLGLSFEIQNDGMHVAAVVAGGPSEAAGIKAGDLITAIDGRSLVGLTDDAALDILRNPQAAQSKVTIARLGASAPVSVTRQQQPAPTVRVDSGVRLQAQPASFDPTSGWWGAYLRGDDPNKTAAVNRSHNPDKPLPVPPGTYDIYVKASTVAPPVRLASGIVVTAGAITTIAASAAK